MFGLFGPFALQTLFRQFTKTVKAIAANLALPFAHSISFHLISSINYTREPISYFCRLEWSRCSLQQSGRRKRKTIFTFATISTTHHCYCWCCCCSILILFGSWHVESKCTQTMSLALVFLIWSGFFFLIWSGWWICAHVNVPFFAYKIIYKTFAVCITREIEIWIALRFGSAAIRFVYQTNSSQQQPLPLWKYSFRMYFMFFCAIFFFSSAICMCVWLIQMWGEAGREVGGEREIGDEQRERKL